MKTLNLKQAPVRLYPSVFLILQILLCGFIMRILLGICVILIVYCNTVC